MVKLVEPNNTNREKNKADIFLIRGISILPSKCTEFFFKVIDRIQVRFIFLSLAKKNQLLLIKHQKAPGYQENRLIDLE